MAKNSQDSLDLLLDTMCNTFGGIIFLAFSISLMLFSSKNFHKVQPDEKIDEQVITDLKQEIQSINADIVKIRQEFQAQESSIPESGFSGPDVTQVRSFDDLNEKLRQVNMDIDMIEKENNELKAKIEKEKKEIRKGARTEQQVKRTIDDLNSEKTILKEEIAKLEKIPVAKEKISFARKTDTMLTAYWFMVKDGKLYPLGTTGAGNEYITTKRVGDILYLTLVKGFQITNPVSDEIKNYMKNVNSMCFCKLLVSPESMKDFVALRRYLRTQKMMVDCDFTSDFTLRYGGHPGHSASY